MTDQVEAGDLKGLVVDGALYILMPAIYKSCCDYCHFSDVDPCPHQRKLVYCGDAEDNADHILIADNPDAVATYIAERLT